jgi:predicted O-methyltransferase YrrM
MALARARAAAAALARDRERYPALRLKTTTLLDPLEALAALGFDRGTLAVLDRDYEHAAADLFPALKERAKAVGADEVVRKLEQPELPAHASKRLVYLTVRALDADVVFETGTFTGTLSTFMLRALEENGHGRLCSFDVPARAPIPHAIDIPLPAGADPGWIIPADLRSRFELVLGDSRRTLPERLAAEPRLDVFVHDSLHTTRHMLFEYRQAWRRLAPGGVLLSDDAFMTASFWWFTQSRRLPFWHIGNMGVTRKPLLAQ